MRKSNWGCLRIVKDGLVSQVSKWWTFRLRLGEELE